MNEALLVSRAALTGDREAFGQLVERYQSPVKRLLFNLTGGDAELSKDLAQDTFVKAWLGIGSFRAAAGFSTWLYRIAYNVFVDSSRRRKIVFERVPATVSSVTAAAASHLAVPPAENDPGIDLMEALSVLGEEERAAVLLFYVEDMTIVKMAKVMGCPVGTIKSRIWRARKKLSQYFSDSGYEQE